MINVKLTTCAPEGWPWKKMFPLGSFEWGPYRFHIDDNVSECDAWIVFESLSSPQTAYCSPSRTVFITGEPDGIGSYEQEFVNQFERVVTSRTDIRHKSVIRMQQGHPWFVEQTYDDLKSMFPIIKTRDVCVITSDKAFTPGHRRRLDFVNALKERLPNELDVYGRGIRDFDSKWGVLAPYRYAIVLENHVADDWITEKLPDAWLSFCYPLYHGCKNLDRYFPEGSWIDIDIDDLDSVERLVRSLLDDEAGYDARVNSILKARQYYLEHQQLIPLLASLLQNILSDSAMPAEKICLLPNDSFKNRLPSRIGSFAVRNFKRLLGYEIRNQIGNKKIKSGGHN